MFQRFTQSAREAVTRAEAEARSLHHGFIGTEHLLLGVAGQEGDIGSLVLGRFGLDAPAVRAEIVRILGPGRRFDDRDEDALRAIGIELDDVRRAAEDAFGPGALERSGVRPGRGGCAQPWGPGHIPFTRRAKKSLELALRWAVTMRHGSIGTEHLLLGMAAEHEGLAAQILRSHGIDLAVVRAAVEDDLSGGTAAS